MLHPASDRCGELIPFQEYHYAHRGLWDAGAGIPENSLPAFAAAADAGYAIELDVHLTADGNVIVFHDDSTGRMCGTSYTIEQTDWSTLASLHLAGTAERIPLFSEVLAVVDGRVPLLIELKLPSRDLSLCGAVMQLLAGYRGPYVIESFNTFGLRWLKKNRPEVLRGQLSARFPRTLNIAAPARWLTTMLLVNPLGRPHFISYRFADTDTPGFRACRKLFRTPCFLWTIRTREQFLACRESGCTAIFERIRPDRS
ncbi:MAG: glycerophosphodiester phosphodiesterase [Eubacterium sp.]|nr:glycerophosphodiester phosphodiesterase [Eubacterium sp.]